MRQNELWNQKFISNRGKQRKSFLEEYHLLIDCLPEQATILDLGCGDGNTCHYLLDKGFNIVGADFSEVALEIVKSKDARFKTVCFDMTGVFPFDDESFDMIVANLSTHYFSYETTNDIYRKIWNKLKKGGYLFFRVNSYNELRKKDTSDIVEEIEKDYYRFKNGKTKRFFNIDSMQDVLSDFSIVTIFETESTNGGSKKYAIEGVAKK